MFLLVSPTAFSQGIDPEIEEELTKKIQDWNEAWRIKDPVLASKWYSDKADFTNAFGFTLEGRKEIETYLRDVFEMDFVMAGNSVQTSLHFRVLADDVILAISKIERAGQKTNALEELGTRYTTHFRTFQKRGSWKIVAHLISDARSTESAKH